MKEREKLNENSDKKMKDHEIQATKEWEMRDAEACIGVNNI